MGKPSISILTLLLFIAGCEDSKTTEPIRSETHGASGTTNTSGTAGQSTSDNANGGVADLQLDATTPADGGASLVGASLVGAGGTTGIAEPSIAGSGGTGGVTACALENGVCPSPCTTLAVVHGCGGAAQRESLCVAVSPVTAIPACGVNLATGKIYRLDVSRPAPTTGWQMADNPFRSIPGYRACDKTEIAATDCWPVEEAANQKVTFQVTNESGVSQSLLTNGFGCSTFGIQREADQTQLLLGVDELLCPCPPRACDPGRIENFTSLAPGATHALEWDARELQLVERIVACQSQDEHEPHGVPVRAKPGRYRASIGLDYQGAAGNAGWAHVPTVYPVCKSQRKIDVEFTLPESGDVVVPVSLK
jgi:hypothetical protein